MLDAPKPPPKGAEEYATMDHATKKIVEFPSESSEDVLTVILRDGARQMLSQAIRDEVTGYVEAREELRDEDGR